MYMRSILYSVIVVITASLLSSCRPPEHSDDGDDEEGLYVTGSIPIDSLTVVQFFESHSELKSYENTAVAVYRRNGHVSLWVGAVFGRLDGRQCACDASAHFVYRALIAFGVFLDQHLFADRLGGQRVEQGDALRRGRSDYC